MSPQRPGPGGRQRTLLVICQVYPPDPTAVGQYVADAAEEMVHRGWRVVVLTSREGYDDPTVHHPPREVRNGVEVRRLPWCSFGKASLANRLAGGLSFVFQSMLHGLTLDRIDLVLVSTVPPMASLAALVVGPLRHAPIAYWVMDLNPDLIVALGQLPARALPVRLMDWLNRRILARAASVVVLDRYMARRVTAKRDVGDKLSVLPPWSLDTYLEPVPHGSNPFRSTHGLEGKRVVMHSGNHGPNTPFTAVLGAAARLQDDPRLVFMFIGGGVGKKEVEAARLSNVRTLPYQPLNTLRHSLSAADVHLVSMGDDAVGIVHPSKVYNAMAVARPILFFGPAESHIGDLMRQEPIGWCLRHGDVAGTVEFFRQLMAMPDAELESRGRRARALVEAELSKERLCAKLCDILERA